VYLEETNLSLTEQLQRYSDGDRIAAESILREVMPELHRIAVRALGREQGHACSPTELINEVWIRKLKQGGWQINGRQHFYAVASLAMRQVLIELARARKAGRRGGSDTKMSTLDGNGESAYVGTADPETLLHLGLLMDQLEQRNPEAARIVDMHYFAGFTFEEIADITGLTMRQVRHRWERGRDWLKDGLLR
jgi:RNA polymerase sigma factor (TIGR02999 family)